MKNLAKYNFPEEYFSTNNDNYLARVKSGKVVVFAYRHAIASLARNLGDNVEAFLYRMKQLSVALNDAPVYVFENDSTDGTDVKLKAFAAQHPFFTCISTKMARPKNEQDKSARRRKDMADYRNLLKNAVATLSPNIDYYVLVDSDVLGGYSISGIYNSFGYDNWDVMGSNSILIRASYEQLYYDTWAFRASDSWDDKNVNKMVLNNGEEPFKVNSCFGGLAIYKWDVIKHLQYNDTDCDHVTINKQIVESGSSIYCNPSQIVLYNSVVYSE